jgi:hypothetical protein
MAKMPKLEVDVLNLPLAKALLEVDHTARAFADASATGAYQDSVDAYGHLVAALRAVDAIRAAGDTQEDPA